MSEKINLYVKFIQNEQKRLNSSTIVAPRQLNEVQGQRGGGGAAGPEPRVGPGGTALPSAYQAAMRRLEGKAKKEPEAPAKPVPSSYEAALKRQTEKQVKPEPTTSPSAAQVAMTPPVSPPSSSNLAGKAVKAGAATAGALGAYELVSQTAKETEAIEKGRQTPPPAPQPKEPPKAVEPAKPTPKPQEPPKAAEPTPSQEDEKDDSSIVSIGKGRGMTQPRSGTMKKEALERFRNMQKPCIPNSFNFLDVSEQEVKAQPVKAKPVDEPIKAEPVKAGSEMDSELEDMPGTNPKEQGAKFQPTVKSPEYMDYLRQNQDKIIAAKRAREEAGAFKSKIQASSTSADVDSL